MNITLSQAKALKFKKHDNNYNKLMAQETETKVIFDNIEADFSNIELINKMVYIKATDLTTGYGCFIIIE